MNKQQLANKIWASANKMRSKIEANEYKDYILGICFVALKVYKELERLLRLSGCLYSVDETLRIAETVVTIEIACPENNDTITKTLCLTEEERAIAYLRYR